jgi:hypothetical protein
MTVVALLHWVGPLGGCAWAIWAGKSRVQLLLASAVGGLLAGLSFVVPLVQMSGSTTEGLDRVPYVLLNSVISSVIMGACIGVAVLVVRSVVTRLSARTHAASPRPRL